MTETPTITAIAPKERQIVRARRRVMIQQDQNPLMGAQEAALALGVKQSNLREMAGLPKPFQTLACGSIWLSRDILQYREWRRQHPPRPGPKKGWKQARAVS